MIIVGIFAPKNTYLSRTQVIKSPVGVVWRQLVTIENYASWQSQIEKVTNNNGGQVAEGTILLFFMKNYEQSVFHEVQVTDYEPDKKLTIERIGVNENPLLKEYKTNFNLKPLLDGTTEITIEITYKPASFVTRIYNQLYLKGSISNICEKNLLALRDLIESS
jgi:hypothetical protein